MYLPGVLLLEAAAHGREPIVNALLEAGVSIYEVDDEASSALLNATFYASTQGHRDVCRRLVEKTADPTLFNMNKLSPLDGALMRSDTELRRVFQQSESDKDFTIEARKQTNLHSAIDANDEEMAMLELGGVGNIDSCKVLGVTPLMLAARSGSRKITQLLSTAAPNRSARVSMAAPRSASPPRRKLRSDAGAARMWGPTSSAPSAPTRSAAHPSCARPRTGTGRRRADHCCCWGEGEDHKRNE